MEVFVTVLLSSGLRSSITLLLAALGETYNEKAGLLNLGIEGMILNGAFGGFYVAFNTGSVFLGFVAGLVVGIISGLIFGYLAITLKLNQVVVGIGFTIFATGITSFLFRYFYGRRFPTLDLGNKTLEIPLLSKIPVLGPMLFDQHLVVYLALLMVPVFHLVMTRTSFGLNVKAVGESPVAADASGVNVVRIRYAVSAIAGATAGLGGAFLSIGDLSFFLPGMTQGIGFIAIAIAMLGRWAPYRVFIGAFLFGLVQSLDAGLQTQGIPVRPEFIHMLPYIGVIVALVFLARNARLPAALALPYERGRQ
ncbi:MAG: ABC transporter permease [Candidatus Bipolaricaulia bacterium]